MSGPVTILQLPDCMIENILSYLTYDDIATKIRLVSDCQVDWNVGLS